MSSRHDVARAARRLTRAPVRAISQGAMDLLKAYDWPGNMCELRNVIRRACSIAEADTILPLDLPPRLRDSAAPRAALPEEGNDYRGRLHSYERRIICDALRTTGGNKTAASRLLAIPLRTLTHKLKTLAIAPDDYLRDP